MGQTPRGIVFPGEGGHTRIWEHIEDTARSVDAALGGAVDAFAVRSAPVVLSGHRTTALPNAVATVVSMTDVRHAGAAGSGVRAGTVGGQPGLFVRVDEPCTLILHGMCQPGWAGDSWRIPMAPLVVDATPDDWFGVGAIIAGTRVQAYYMNRNTVTGIHAGSAGSADASLPTAHTSITMSLVAYRLV